jgi:polyphenol oxidase
MDWVESAEAIGKVDELLASVGLGHGRRKTLSGTWAGGERLGKPQIPGALRDKTTGSQRRIEVVRAVGWERYGWLRHGFSTRTGGVSEIYGSGSLNLGWTKEDEAGNVVENRRRFLAEIAGNSPFGGVNRAKRAPQSASSSPRLDDDLKDPNLVGLRQFHSGMIRVVEQDDGLLVTAEGRPVLRGDGVMTDVPGLMLGVGVADCVPVLVADVKRRAVAAFHAGWRGTLARIVERGIGTMRLRYGSRPEDLVAVVGPSIGACCYSVGEEVRFEFESQFAYAPALFSEVYDSDPVRDKYPLLFLTARAPGHSNIGPQIHLNLWEANRRQLVDAGVKAKRITVVGECSACVRAGVRLKYFSHRGESGFAGRMMGVVGIAAQ